MEWANAYDGPVYLRLVRDAVPDVLPADYTFTPGVVVTLREGRDVAVVSTGPQTGRVLSAAAQLSQQGICPGSPSERSGGWGRRSDANCVIYITNQPAMWG